MAWSVFSADKDTEVCIEVSYLKTLTSLKKSSEKNMGKPENLNLILGIAVS